MKIHHSHPTVIYEGEVLYSTVESKCVSEANIELVTLAMHIFIEDAKDAFIIIDREGKIHFVNKKMTRLTGGNEDDFLGKYLEDIITISRNELESAYESEKILKGRIRTPQGRILSEICVKPVHYDGKAVGAMLILKGRQRGPDYLGSLEALGSTIQGYSNAQKIYETLRKELSTLGMDMVVFSREEDWFIMRYYTFDIRKMRITEFIMSTSLSEIKVGMKEETLKKMVRQKFVFSRDVSSLLASATSHVSTSDLRRFFSVCGFSKGIVTPVMYGDILAGFMVFLSDKLTPDDGPSMSALGIQASAALERAHYFGQLVTDLKALEDKITARTQELRKVKSQMESIVQSSVDAIIATDLDGTVTFVNRGVEAMLGFSESDILGQPITNYYKGGVKEAKKMRGIILKQGRMENVELNFLTEDGRAIITLGSLSLLKDEKGTVTGILAVLKDITEEKRLQQTLESLNTAAFLIQRSRTKEEIFKVTAEELKRMDFYVAFMLFNREKTAARIAYVTVENLWDNFTDLEKKLIDEYDLPLDGPLVGSLIKKNAIYLDAMQTAVKEIVPHSLHEVVQKRIDLLGVSNKRLILAPLIIHGEARGFLGVISDGITHRDIPSITAFANQVSTALENARLLKESMDRADELARNLEEQLLLRELNTNLFLAQSQDEVFDAAIEGIHKLGKTFSIISVLTEEKTHSRAVRMKMESKMLKIAKRIGNWVKPGLTLLNYEIPVWEEDNIYHKFFETQIPLISSNIQVSGEVMKGELSDFYTGLAPKGSFMQDVIEVARKLMAYRSFMIFPIMVGGSAMGSMAVTGEKIFTERDFALMKTAGEMISSAMERISHSERLAETLNELRAVQRINTLLNMGAPLEEILLQVSSSIQEVYHYQFAYPLILDSSRRYLTLALAHMIPPLEKVFHKALGVTTGDFKYPIAENFDLFNPVISEKKCLIWKGFAEITEIIPTRESKSAFRTLFSSIAKFYGLKPGESHIMVAPLPYGEEVIGVLFLGHRKSLTEEDFHRLEYFLDQVGIAIAKSDVEYRLRESLRELKELDEMKSEFIDIASHELRTPLTTLKLYLEMMALEQYGKLSEPIKERVRVMEEGVSRLEDIINQTLVASRLIKNKLTLEKEPVSLLEIATEAINHLRPLWEAKSQNIFLERPPALSKINGDRKALFTVMSNLVDNAVRYSSENTEILIKFAERPREVECMVIDHGYGIPPEHIEKIFEEFYIVPSETEYARMDGRTGLGLFIAKGIIERHEGKIWVESIVGEGSTFHFTIPKGV